ARVEMGGGHVRPISPIVEGYVVDVAGVVLEKRAAAAAEQDDGITHRSGRGQEGRSAKRGPCNPGIVHDVIAIVQGRAAPPALATHQVDELPDDGGSRAAHGHRDVRPRGVPGVGYRVVLPRLVLFGTYAVATNHIY